MSNTAVSVKACVGPCQVTTARVESGDSLTTSNSFDRGSGIARGGPSGSPVDGSKATILPPGDHAKAGAAQVPGRTSKCFGKAGDAKRYLLERRRCAPIAAHPTRHTRRTGPRPPNRAERSGRILRRRERRGRGPRAAFVRRPPAASPASEPSLLGSGYKARTPLRRHQRRHSRRRSAIAPTATVA